MDLTAKPVLKYQSVLNEIDAFLKEFRQDFYDVTQSHIKLSKRLNNLSNQLQTVIDIIPFYDLLSDHLEEKFPPKKEVLKICGYLNTIASQIANQQRDTILIYDLHLEINRFLNQNRLSGKAATY